MKVIISEIPKGARVLDARFRLADPSSGRRLYLEEHIPGALFVDLDTEMSGAKTGRNGRHPLPARAALAELFGRLGISADTEVVCYDDTDHAGAARLWMLLRWMGHAQSYVLNGGLKAWKGALVSGAEALPAPAKFVERESLIKVSGPSGLLVDARAPERYRGEVEPLDPVAGHIPGAKNYFYQQLLADGLLQPDRLPAFGGAPIFYCGSGVTASVLLLAATELDREAAIYPGSWSEWCAVNPGLVER
jgi:thiosulfate/3-mercaptopyruvate sulfurtransferase